VSSKGTSSLLSPSQIAGWLIGTGESSGIKSVTAFYPEQAADSNGTPPPSPTLCRGRVAKVPL